MAQSGSRRGASNLGIPLMLLSFILLGGFLYWLYITAVPTEPAVTEQADSTAADMTAIAADPGSLAIDASQYEGQTVRLPALEVAAAVGRRAFFLNLTDQTPFLVRMDSALVARGMTVPTGRVRVVGDVVPMTDSIITQWTSAGDITEGDRPVVEFATHFILAHQVQSAPPAGDGSSGGN